MEKYDLCEKNQSRGSILSLSTIENDKMPLDTSPVPRPIKIADSEREPKITFKARYNIKKVICKGGQANVHKAYDKKSCKEVAIKVYKKEKLKRKEFDAIYREK